MERGLGLCIHPLGLCHWQNEKERLLQSLRIPNAKSALLEPGPPGPTVCCGTKADEAGLSSPGDTVLPMCKK